MLINIVTTNAAKFEVYRQKFKNYGLAVKLRRASLELNEIQTLNMRTLIKNKLQQAKTLLPGKKIIVDDRGFCISALNNFPGTFMKTTIDAIGVDGFLKLMAGEKDRTAKFVVGIGFFDGKKDHIFIDEEIGKLFTKKRGSNLRGWTEILYIYGDRYFPKKTLAELTDKQWSVRMKKRTNNGIYERLGKAVAKRQSESKLQTA